MSQSRYRRRDDRRNTLIKQGSEGDEAGESTEKSTSVRRVAVDHLATMCPHIVGLRARRPQYVDANGAANDPEGA
jgi:hypothetical protein